MKIKVRNFRGVERADIDISGVTILAGNNGAGKSSICQAVSAAVSGHPIPFLTIGKGAEDLKPLLLKKDVSRLIRSGMKKASVQVGGKDGSTSVDWPKCEVETEGKTPPRSGVFSSGIVSVVDMSSAVRGEYLSDRLGANADASHLKARLEDDGLGDEAIETALADLESFGWDDAHSKYKADATTLKGKWEGITGEKWGAKKGEGWVHPDTAESSLDDLEQVLLVAQETSEALAGQGAVSKERSDNLLRQIELAKDDADDLEDAEVDYQDAQALVGKIEGESGPGEVVIANTKCSACGELLFVGRKGDDIYTKKAVSPSGKDAKKAKEFLADKKVRLEKANAILHDANTRLGICRAAAKRLEELRKEYGEIGEVQESASREDIEAARDEVSRAANDIANFKKRDAAAKVHKEIKDALVVAAATAPDGVRRERLVRALRDFNEGALEGLCRGAKYRAIKVEDDMMISYDGRPFPLLSESEKFRVKSVMQFALARDDESIVIIDGADILDKSGLNGLMKISNGSDKSTLIGMTISEKKDVPDLAKIGIGQSYWVEDGSVEAIGV